MGSIDDALGWNKLSWTKKILIAIPLVGAFAGWQYYTKNKEGKEMKANMLTMCQGEKAQGRSNRLRCGYIGAWLDRSKVRGRAHRATRVDTQCTRPREMRGVQHRACDQRIKPHSYTRGTCARRRG